MKKLLIAVIALATLAGCKKGENDPFLSFRGRDARIIGEWKLSSYSYDEENKNSFGNTSTKVTYDGTKYTTVNSPGQAPADNGEYTYTLNIEKGGKVTMTTDIKNGNLTSQSVEEGTWFWLNNNKNKSVIALNINGSAGNNYFTGGFYEVDQLKNKEVILKSSSNGSNTSSGAAGSSSSFTNSTSATLTQ